jgi:septum formation protein
MTSAAGESPIASSSPPGAAGPSLRATLVLASSSPRRLALLRQAGIEPDLVLAPEIDETPAKGELPRAYAGRMAFAKVQAARDRLASGSSGEGVYLLAADTVVACGRRILPKAATVGEAQRCLALLGGRRHRVHGGVAVLAPDGRVAKRVVTTIVQMKRLTDGDLRRYLAGGEWRGKAGGYAIQGMAAALVPALNGSYTNVVGLPLTEALAMLEGLGWRWPEGPR